MNVTHLAVGRNGRQRIHTGWMLQVTDDEFIDLLCALHEYNVLDSNNSNARINAMHRYAQIMQRARDDFLDTTERT